jgi:hypothetical protein
MLIAARVAAKLKGSDREVRKLRGGLGEFRVTVDGTEVYDGKRYMYPRPKTVIEAVNMHLGREKGA